ncbi:putative cleavage and polyadenylation specificity factor subunit 4-like protein [Talpa occidentalis]|uniref:putative cleavage and polyadenylation specificity factor subunit 4-like protein n=1 Tax=Talpa occidentalis TaxID=50954 RepID=UPI001890934A|nr:putative cleavage and polyadenylation specificity factor subunit 4-like protein [Talpa occidentalis]
MQEVIAGLERFSFTFEKDVESQKGVGLLPFQCMDKSGSAMCNFFTKGLCGKGKLCPFRHDQAGKQVVCKHWLRGLCKKGDQCKFLHQYDAARMPTCYFYSKFGGCNNKECSFLHVNPAGKTGTCPWYDQGFCKDGPLCKYRHVRRKMCMNYLVGFCPQGPECQFAHPKMNVLFNPSCPKSVNWPCGSAPPASAWNPGKPWTLTERPLLHPQRKPQECPPPGPWLRGPEQVPCYHCGKMSHYARKCSKTQLVGVIKK